MSNNQAAVRWSIQVSKETDLSLRSYLESHGIKNGERSKFIEQAVLRQVFQHTVDDIHNRNRDTDPAQIEAEIETALLEVRAEKKRPSRARKRRA